MPYTEHTPPETHPSGDGQDGTDKSKDGVFKDKGAEVEQAADGTVNLALGGCQAHRAESRLITGRRISGDRQATTSTTSNPDHGMSPRSTMEHL